MASESERRCGNDSEQNQYEHAHKYDHVCGDRHLLHARATVDECDNATERDLPDDDEDDDGYDDMPLFDESDLRDGF